MKVIFLVLSVFVIGEFAADAQRVSVGTNVVEWANLGTINAEAGVAVGQHFSVHAGVRINPWTWRTSDPAARFEDPIGDSEKQFQNKKQSYALSLRWWPWYVYSDWWFALKAQYAEYDYGGFITHPREAGDAFGGGLMAGYTYMLHEHWNIEFGVGVWAGYKKYGTYRCTNCGQPTGSGEKFFVMPDEVKVSLVYVF